MAKGTLTQKILAAHLVHGSLERNERIEIRIDQTLTQDATGTMAYLELEAMKTPKAKTELSVSYIDHNMQQNGPENQNDHLYLQSIAAAKGIVFSRAGNGICHQVHLERFGVPGKTLLGSDSHTPTNGGIGMIAIGAGGLDIARAIAGFPFRLTAPTVIGVKLNGELRPWVAAKDIILHLLSILSTKGNVGCIVEYFGEGVKTLSVPQRATVTNMGAELGVTTSLFPSDEATHQFLKAQGREADFTALSAETDVEYDRVIEIDLSALRPLAACPSSPDNIRPIAELVGIPVSQVLIGSCTNSSFKDLMRVASVMKGRTICPTVSAAIAPGSRQVMEMLAKNGALADLIDSGFRILESGCGPCIGQGFSPAEGTVSLRTFNRNFPSRSGTKGDQVYLVSPETAVCAALTGVITDPAAWGEVYPEVNDPAEFLINDRMILSPPKDGEGIEIVRKSTIGEPPANHPLPDLMEGEILLKCGDKITTDHISPAGPYLKYRSNIPRYAQVVFEIFNEEGKPTFAQRAEVCRDSGRHGIIVARESYGQGSSREHAAICPMYLGIKAVVAVSIERIHTANLINFGILPLNFANPSDYDLIEAGDTLRLVHLREQLKPGMSLHAEIVESNGAVLPLILVHSLTGEDIAMILAGGCLHYNS